RPARRRPPAGSPRERSHAPGSGDARRAAGRGVSRVTRDDGLLRDRYELKEALGSGGQGEVFRAEDHQHHRPVAIKVRPLPPEGERQALLREAKTLLTLTPHPGLALARDDFFDG